ncbi:MAG: response regulator [Treponema sp.]|nr:response regulator [Treponema sp.]
MKNIVERTKKDGSPIKVLIVDDSIFITKQLNQILASAGYEVVGIANNGGEALELYQELSPNIDLVTMDITMPKMDGITALEKIIAFDKNAKVVMVTAIGKEDLVKKAILAGAKNFIIKPLDRTAILARLNAVCADLC